MYTMSVKTMSCSSENHIKYHVLSYKYREVMNTAELLQVSEDAIMADSEDAISTGSEEIKKFLAYCDSCLNEKKN